MSRTFQSVSNRQEHATTTSFRIPSTSWAYQSGNVSLSPSVMRIPYGSTELSRSAAQSRVNVCPARDAARWLAKKGTNASNRIGALRIQPMLEMRVPAVLVLADVAMGSDLRKEKGTPR